MRIAGIDNNSFVDYPGKIAYVVFCEGCNMNCYYCHNRGIIGNRAKTLYTPDFILSELTRKKKLLDGVVVTGGEPTLQPDLAAFIKKVLETGLTVKLDTNGLRPDVVRALLKEGLLDYIAMDIKAPFTKYQAITLRKLDLSLIQESIDLIKNSGIAYEFRTTMCPDLTAQDIGQIAKELQGAKLYSIQQYRLPAPAENFYDPRLDLEPHPPSVLEEAKTLASPFVERCIIKGL